MNVRVCLCSMLISYLRSFEACKAWSRHVKMSFIFGKRYFTFPLSQKGQISLPFPLWLKGQLYFSRYFSCIIFNMKSTAGLAGFGLKSVEDLVLKVLAYGWMIWCCRKFSKPFSTNCFRSCQNSQTLQKVKDRKSYIYSLSFPFPFHGFKKVQRSFQFPEKKEIFPESYRCTAVL